MTSVQEQQKQQQQYYAMQIGALIKEGVEFAEFSARLKMLVKSAWRGSAASFPEDGNLVDVCGKAVRHLNQTKMPLDMLVQAIEAYRVHSTADLALHKLELIALANWAAVLAATPVIVKPSTIDGAGFGLFADAPIGANVAVVPYGGISVQSPAEAAEHGAYVVEIDKCNVIDAACGFRLAEMARWANGHPPSDKWCTAGRNNCALVRNPHDNNRVYLTTTVPVAEGEELFASYGDFYRWELLGYEPKQV